MIEKIIKLLGGFTDWDIERVEIKCEEKIAAEQAELFYLKELLSQRDAEVLRLTNLMLVRAGFVNSPVAANEERPQPINKRQSWPQKQKELEREDVRRLTDETERRWKSKPGAMLEGESGNGSFSSESVVS